MPRAHHRLTPRPKRAFSKSQIERMPKEEYRHRGIIHGLNGRLLVKDQKGGIWSFSPVQGREGFYHRTRVAVWVDRVQRMSIWRRGGKLIERNPEREEAVEKAMRRKIDQRREGIPEYNSAEFELNISRQEFGKIYQQLMNEINVRLDSGGRAPAFDERLQKIRERQARDMVGSQRSLSEIHHQLNVESEIPDAGMTNERGACFWVREHNGRPVIEIRDRYPADAKTQEIGYISMFLESMLKELGIPYSKKAQ